MQAHHYLGSRAKIGVNLWYVATYLGEWLALSSFSTAALKCVVRYRLELPAPVLAYCGSMGEFRQGLIGLQVCDMHYAGPMLHQLLCSLSLSLSQQFKKYEVTN